MTRDFARKLRREQTDVERTLWNALRDRRFGGFKFRRQQPIDHYIADFVCLECKLVVELDGAQHAAPENAQAEARRTAYLQHNGFRVLRFWNREVNDNLEGVLETIWRALQERRGRAPSPERSRG